MDFARKNFPGHQAIVCAHDNGENRSGNIHVHIVINSLRKRDVDRQSFMERKSDSRAGFKHHLTDKYLTYLKRDLMETCKKEKLHQVDLLSPAKRKVTDREYWADTRGKIKDGPDFKTRKDMLRSAIEDAASKCTSEKDFSKILKDKYGIVLKVSRGRYSYIIPGREKAIRGRALGTDYTEETLRLHFKENSQSLEQISPETESTEKLNGIRSTKNRYPKAFTMRSDLPLVRDLQVSAITTANRAYDRKSKITNLKQMADTILYVEDQGFDTRNALDSAYDKLHETASDARYALKQSEDSIKALNEQIHYTGQYLANKGTYQAYMKAKNKGRFRSEHEAEIILYEAARKYLKDHAADGTLPSYAFLDTERGKFPNISKIKSIRSELISEQKQLRENYHSARDAEKELYAIKKNVDTMLRDPELYADRKRHKTEALE